MGTCTCILLDDLETGSTSTDTKVHGCFERDGPSGGDGRTVGLLCREDDVESELGPIRSPENQLLLLLPFITRLGKPY